MDQARRFDGKIALITGGGTGIGAAVARRMAADGANVVLMGRRAAPLAEVARDCSATVVVGDAANTDDVKAAIAKVVETHGGLDILVANAGGHGVGPTMQTSNESWATATRLNLDTAFVCARECLPELIRARGTIVIVASIAGLFAGPGAVGYVTMKHACIGLGKSLARDFGRLGVRTNMICPGWVSTAMADEQMDHLRANKNLSSVAEAYALVTKDVPAGRAATPEEVSNVICFVASAEAVMMNGAIVTVDGGSSVVDLPTLAFYDAPRFLKDKCMTDTPEGWLNYDDFSAGIDTNRLPRTDALSGHTMKVRLQNGRSFRLAFQSGMSVLVEETGTDSTEWCEVVNTAPDTYFIDLTFAARPNTAETLIVSTDTRRVLSIRCVIRPERTAPGEPRVAQDWVPGVLESGIATGAIPHETRDLIGLRAFYTYSPNHVYEHIYLSSARYAWQNLIGVQRGHGDTDLATTFKFADNLYVFGFREFIIPVASVFFYNFDTLRSTGKFLGETGASVAQNSPAGAFIEKASMTFYPTGKAPV